MVRKVPKIAKKREKQLLINLKKKYIDLIKSGIYSKIFMFEMKKSLFQKGVEDLLRISNKAKLVASIFTKIFVSMLLGCSMLIALLLVVYKPVYNVSYGDESLGYVQNKNVLQKNIDNYLKYGDSENVGYVILKEAPEYTFELAKKDLETKDEEIYAYIKDKCDVYYKVYAVESDEKEVCVVETLAMAQEIVDKVNEKQKNFSKKAELTISEKYEKEYEATSDVELAVADVYEPINKKNAEVIRKYVQPSAGKVVSATLLAELKEKNEELNFTLPLESYVITSRFGWRRNGTDFHTGIDYAAPLGTPIHAAEDGIVTCAKWSGNYGYLVKVQHTGGYETYYAHCSRFAVSVGDEVKQGDVVSYVGSTGRSTGPHVHLEIRIDGKYINPQDLL